MKRSGGIHTIYNHPRMDPTLAKIANKIMAEEAQEILTERAIKREEAQPKGKGVVPALSDEDILEMRALAEFAGWKRRHLAAYYGVDVIFVTRVVTLGCTRALLVATREHLPNPMPELPDIQCKRRAKKEKPT